MVRIRVGVCGWSDPTLLASGFYPPGTKSPERRLSYYAGHFSLVEVDSTYYSLPSQAMARHWVERTPPDFRFDVKAYRLFTGHPTPAAALPPGVRPLVRGQVYYKDLSPEVRERLWQAFAEALLPLDSAGKLGAVLFQFPPWFLPGEESWKYILSLRERLPQYPLAIEFRQERWLSPENREGTSRFLRENGLSYVCVDEPQGFPSSLPPLAEVTAPLALVRFHGRNRETWVKGGLTAAQRFQYLYSPQELQEWLPRIQGLAQGAREVHLLFNNCYSDWAVRNARDMVSLLRSQPGLFPDFQG